MVRSVDPNVEVSEHSCHITQQFKGVVIFYVVAFIILGAEHCEDRNVAFRSRMGMAQVKLAARNIARCITYQVIFYANSQVASSLHILHLSVRKWVQNGTEDSVVLDCVYNANREDEHLVIKWFLNDDPQPIYQWIPELNKRFVSSRLKDRINLDYSLSNGNSFTKFRALNLVRPTTELSGRYSCHVMSLAGQDSESKLMTVYAPPKRFDFTYQRVSAHVTNLSCEADGVFPQPTLFLYQSSGRESRVTTGGLGSCQDGGPYPRRRRGRLPRAPDVRTGQPRAGRVRSRGVRVRVRACYPGDQL
ncbi:hypothetical protein MRX96_010528 [Rhipicephalus microplus]